MTEIRPRQPERTKSDSTVRSVVVSWRLLDALSRSVAPMRVTELAKQLGEPKAKIHRHLSTMRGLGVVEQVTGSEKYRLGWKLYQLGQVAFERFDLKTVADPYMARLRDEVFQSVVLAIPIGAEALLIANLDYTTAGLPKISAVPGTVVPPAVSTTGRIILAFAHRKQQEQILSQPLKAYTKHTITKPDVLRQRLHLIRQRLYDYGSEDLTLGIGTVGGPILPSLFTDYVFREDAALKYSLALSAVITLPIAFGLLWLGLGEFRASLKDAESR
jgi:DNA-binding IclR family transcriptional regulator